MAPSNFFRKRKILILYSIFVLFPYQILCCPILVVKWMVNDTEPKCRLPIKVSRFLSLTIMHFFSCINYYWFRKTSPYIISYFFLILVNFWCNCCCWCCCCCCCWLSHDIQWENLVSSTPTKHQQNFLCLFVKPISFINI